jgi:hypothetical protein
MKILLQLELTVNTRALIMTSKHLLMLCTSQQHSSKLCESLFHLVAFIQMYMSHCSLEDKKSNEDNSKQDAQDGDTQYTINRFFGELENVTFEIYTKLLLNYYCV